MRTYKFRIYPIKKQEKSLNQSFDSCRFVYNQMLEYINNNEKIDRNDLQRQIVILKEKYPELKSTYSRTLQYESQRLLYNLKGLSAKKKNGGKVGRLRFKGKRWFKTIMYIQSGYKLIESDKRFNILRLSKIGDIKILQHRDIEGCIKAIIIKRKIDSWYVHIITDAKYKIDSGEDEVGIDMGVINFLVTSKSEVIDNPLYMNKVLNRLKALHQKLSRTIKGSKNRIKCCNQLSKVWEKIDNQKKDFFHKVSTKIINSSKFVAVEKLQISSMTNNKKNYNCRNIMDSSWRTFLNMLKFKAESAGIQYEEVNPANTSKTCNRCGALKDMPTSIRTYSCDNCGLVIDRDLNAAINIFNIGKGLANVGAISNIAKQEAISFRV